MLQRFEDFVTGITVCHKYIQRIKSAEMTELGLKGTHVMCLFFLHRNPEGLTAAQLCQLCAEDKAAISRTLVTLQKKGYLRSGAQKYRTPLYLTDAGNRLAQQLEGLIQQWVGCGGDGLTDEERTAFYRTLSHIAGNLHKKLEETGKEL